MNLLESYFIAAWLVMVFSLYMLKDEDDNLLSLLCASIAFGLIWPYFLYILLKGVYDS